MVQGPAVQTMNRNGILMKAKPKGLHIAKYP